MAQDDSKLEGLLEPSLAGGSGARAIYSLRACFFVAFFGGPFAILLFAGLNSRRLGRLAADAWIYAVGAIVTVVFIAFAFQGLDSGTAPAWLSALGEGPRATRVATRILAMALFGVVFLAHRRFYKAADLSGEDPPSPWLPGIGATLVGALLSIAIAFAVHGLPVA